MSKQKRFTDAEIEEFLAVGEANRTAMAIIEQLWEEKNELVLDGGWYVMQYGRMADWRRSESIKLIDEAKKHKENMGNLVSAVINLDKALAAITRKSAK